LEFFVHWDQFNKRLDEWVSASRVVLSRPLEWPRPKSTPNSKKNSGPRVPGKAPGKVPKSQSLLKKAATASALQALKQDADASTPSTPASRRASASPAPSPLKRKAPQDEEEEEDEDLDADADADADGDMDMEVDGVDGEGPVFDIHPGETPEPPTPMAAFSKEQEIEKLRTSGSMTQSISEIARVKNLNRLQIGRHEVDAWYFSPYPQEYAHLPVLYICEFCLSYFGSEFRLVRHRKRCTLLHPPGNEIYRHEDLSFFELDGKRQLTYCRNLSMLSKCFLDQ
jgi:histone acetyltransferase HTATIP